VSGDRTRPPQAKGPPSISGRPRGTALARAPTRPYRSSLLRHLDIRLLAASVLTVVPAV
jgi:hypothetical protein